MGVHTHARSPYYQLWLETAPKGHQREGTKIRIGTTNAERRDSRRLADQLYHQRMMELARKVHRLQKAPEAILFRTYAKTYLDDTISHHKGSAREQQILIHLLRYFGGTPLTAIDQDMARAYMTARLHSLVPSQSGRAKKPNVSANSDSNHAEILGKKPGPPVRGRTTSASTVNREVDLLRSMLRDAVPKHLEANPLSGLKRLKTVRTPRRLLQPEEEVRLLEAATDPQDHALLVLGLDTLVRLGDLLDLRRTDRSGLWLTIRDPKAGQPYQVPLSPRAVLALDAITHDQPHYFAKFRRAENPEDWRSSVWQRLRKLCAEARVPFGGQGGITFHGATRKTGATRLLIEKGLPPAVVQRLGNWRKPDVMLSIYTEVQRADLLEAVGQPTQKPRGPKAKPR